MLGRDVGPSPWLTALCGLVVGALVQSKWNSSRDRKCTGCANSAQATATNTEVTLARHEESTKPDPYDAAPRTGYLSWDDYFMAVALLSAQRSKDPSKQVGACIVSTDNIILGIGYNGFPRGCPDKALPWAKKSLTDNVLETKYPYVCHAEMNAVLNKNTASLAGARMYVTMFPCNECAKLLIQAGISEVIFLEGKDLDAARGADRNGILPQEAYAASKHLLRMTGIRTRQHKMHLSFS